MPKAYHYRLGELDIQNDVEDNSSSKESSNSFALHVLKTTPLISIAGTQTRAAVNQHNSIKVLLSPNSVHLCITVKDMHATGADRENNATFKAIMTF
jgi:hypothetical protein